MNLKLKTFFSVIFQTHDESLNFEEKLKKYEKDHIDFYRTDRNGTITIRTDGKSYTVTPERGDKNDDTGN